MCQSTPIINSRYTNVQSDSYDGDIGTTIFIDDEDDKEKQNLIYKLTEKMKWEYRMSNASKTRWAFPRVYSIPDKSTHL